MGTRWRGMLAPIDMPTGDGRRMAKGAFRARPLPLALKWQRIDETGHDTSVVIGLMDRLDIDETAGEVWAEGELFDDRPDLERLSQDVAEAMLLTEKKIIGPSVDAGAAEMVFVREGTDTPLTDADWEQLLREEMESGAPAPIEMLFVDYEIAAATLVAIPAFVEARPFQLFPTTEPATVAPITAAVTGSTDLPIADPDTAWDGPAAMGRVFDKHTNAQGEVDTAAVAKAFLYRNPDADPATKAAYKLGFADVIDGELRMVPRGVAACAGGHGVDAADIPAGEKDRIRSKICTLYGRVQAEHADWPDCPMMGAASTTAAARSAVLTAAAVTVYPADVFVAPQVAPPYQLVKVEPARDGEPFRRVAGYMAPLGVCHVGFRDVCITAPPAGVDYALYHRYPVETSAGLLGVGRITSGAGRVGSGCAHLTCRRNDDHACRQYTLPETIAHHDRMSTVAHVRATEYDGVGIWVQGVLADGAAEADLAVLARQRVSGDWRDYAGHLEMVELLALAREEPGFPVPQTVLRDGRQFSLIAAGAVPPPEDLAAGWGGPRRLSPPDVPAELVEAAAASPDGLIHLVDPAAASTGSEKPCEPIPCEPGLTAAGKGGKPRKDMPEEDMPKPMEHTGAMVALVPSEQDAGRLAVDGGEAAEELHLTLVYLGEAGDINAASRQAIIDSLTALAAEWSTAAEGELSLAGDVFAISAFNPATEGKDPCIVVGVSGEQIAAAHSQVTDAVKAVFGPPAQHLPFVPHITLAYTDDLGLVGQLTDRTGPIVLDRLRVAFAGSNHDIPLGMMPMMPDCEPGEPGCEEMPEQDMPKEALASHAAALLAEVAAALDAPAARDRARTAAALMTQIEEVDLCAAATRSGS